MTVLQSDFSIKNDLTDEANLSTLLARSAVRHTKLCPRQVLGVRMGLYGLALLNLSGSDLERHLMVIVETDGCFADAVEVATGCTIGHRTLRIVDFGKVAATFVNTDTHQALRLAPKPDVRTRAWAYAWHSNTRYQAQLEGYQVMPVSELLAVQPICLKSSMNEIISVAGRRVICETCKEEIMNEREIHINEQVLCQTCGGKGYYDLA